MRSPPPTGAKISNARSVEPLQQFRERVFIIVEPGRLRPVRKRAAKRGGDSSLVGQAAHTDDLAFHVMLGRGVLFGFSGHYGETTRAGPPSFVVA